MACKKVEIKGAVLELVVGDITKQSTDAIVNAANKRLAPGGGVAGAIHRAAGPGLWEECKKLGGCRTGEAKLTKGYDLPAPYVIHTVGPIYSGKKEDVKLLTSCYRSCLRLANSHHLASVAFPALSTGVFGYPLDKAAAIALQTVMDILRSPLSVKLVRFVLNDEHAFQVHETALDTIISLE